ncbi:hypothetical protein LZ30DRAFT_242088 [Colletotrichum cereale]|nr:hypothetical protein LZ30DRAFT_242088 [Colletotrichum cereale]
MPANMQLSHGDEVEGAQGCIRNGKECHPWELRWVPAFGDPLLLPQALHPCSCSIQHVLFLPPLMKEGFISSFHRPDWGGSIRPEKEREIDTQTHSTVKSVYALHVISVRNVRSILQYRNPMLPCSAHRPVSHPPMPPSLLFPPPDVAQHR